jgi:hypothetical protein
MTSKVKKNKINFNGKMVSIGIDMHKHSWRMTALVEGDIAMSVTLAKPNYNSFKKVLARFKGNHVRIVYEAGPGGFDLYDRLTADGIECIVTPPSLIPTESRDFKGPDNFAFEGSAFNGTSRDSDIFRAMDRLSPFIVKLNMADLRKTSFRNDLILVYRWPFTESVSGQRGAAGSFSRHK